MNAVEKSREKNAPLLTGEDRSEFVAWATSVEDGVIAAGWQSPYPAPGDRVPSGALRSSAAKLVSLARKELNQTPEQIAASAGVALEDVTALEQGNAVTVETVTRVAGVLRLDADVLVELFG